MLRQIHFDKNSSNVDEEDDSEVVIMVENKQSLEEHSISEALINQVLENWRVAVGQDCPKIYIEEFRGDCLSNFHRYFRKKWNKDKSGQDQGVWGTSFAVL